VLLNAMLFFRLNNERSMKKHNDLCATLPEQEGKTQTREKRLGMNDGKTELDTTARRGKSEKWGFFGVT
jgi:hypothetical protein